MTDVEAEAEWPDRFVYVCKATQAAIVNVAPLLHAGLDRVVGMVVLCGARAREDKDPDLRREAIDPAARLARWAADRIGLDEGHIVVHAGDPDSVLPWAEGMRKAASMAQSLSAEVVFNLNGGRTGMTFGAQMFWPDDAPPRYTFHVSGRPLRAWLIEPQRDGLRERRLPAAGHLTIADYLGIYGVTEFSLASREEIEGAFLKRAGMAAHLHERAVESPLHFGAWNRSFARAQAPFPCTVRLSNDEQRAVRAYLDNREVEGLKQRGAECTVDEPAAKFLSGGWLEGLIYNRALDEFGNDREVSIGSNLRLRFAGSRSDFGEIDVAFMRGDQLHLIEAKAVRDAKSQGGQVRLRDSLARLAYMKRQLLGQQGRAWLVAPLLDHAQIRSGDYARAASEAGVRLLFGRDAVDTLFRELASVR
jgi:hypothetical protein